MPLQALDTVAGFEPTSVPFTQGCFTIKLHRNKSHYFIAVAQWVMVIAGGMRATASRLRSGRLSLVQATIW